MWKILGSDRIRTSGDIMNFIILIFSLVFFFPTQNLYAKKTYRVGHKKIHHKGLKKKPRKKRVSTGKRWVGTVKIPDKLDLRPNLSPIQNQGACGSCWSFSLTATLEDGLKSPQNLSQQYLVNCARNSYGCQGGYFDAADYLMSPLGAPTKSDLPYQGVQRKCTKKPIKGSIKAWDYLGDDKGPTVKDIETYMTLNQKPVSTVVAAGAGDWESYEGGVYNGCETGRIDHMINIVGWDNEGETFNEKGNLPPGKGLWILRNSWGKDWGEQGWMVTKMTDEKGRKCNNVGEEAVYLVPIDRRK